MMDGYAPLIRVVGLALPLLIGFAAWGYVRRRQRAARRLGDRVLIASLIGEDLSAVPRLRLAAILAAAALLGFSMTDPRWGEATEQREGRGGRLVLVLDASSSMLAEDIAPNRLERQRDAAHELVRRMPDAAIAVVMFAGRAYALVPPTTDRGALDLYLQSLHPSMVTQTGSSLTAAIRQGLGLLAAGQEESTAGVLVLVSDGDTVDDPGQVAEVVDLARRAGIPIFVLGAGTAAGAPVPDIDLTTGRRLGYKREPNGAMAISRLNEGVLREIARGSGGEYAPLDDPRSVDRIAEQLQRSSSEAAGGSGDAPPQFTWFAAGALLLLVLESLSDAGRARRQT